MSDQQTIKETDNKPDSTTQISRDQYDALNKQYSEIKEKYSQVAKTLKEQEEQKLKETGQWKEAYEREKANREENEQKIQRLNETFVTREKYMAVKSAAHKAGIKSESDLEYLDLKDVLLETTSTGKINVIGADAFIEKIKTLKPHWFGDKNPPNVNTQTPGVSVDTTGKITTAMILAAEVEGKKSGDMSKYYDLTKKYMLQKKGA